MNDKMKIFNTYHPLGLFIYFASAIVITMFMINPVMLTIAIISGIAFVLTLTDIRTFLKNLAYEIPFFILIALTNPLFSHNGVTPLFFLNGNAVTLEAVLYGLDMGIMILGVIYWCKCYSIIVDSEKFIYLFGKAIPKLSLVLSMALKFVPVFKRQYRKISDAQKCFGYYATDSYFDKIRNALRVFSCLITWSLESSIDTSVAMKAKGYGLKGRTHFHNFRFHIRDLFLIAVTLFMDIVVFTGIGTDIIDFRFYPKITQINLNAESIAVYGAFIILMFMPAFLEIKEKIKWKYYVERI
ncbi:MAG: energy-coupling factor transporter transmembrane protein EcfT [Lachnospiraceae bacterium]|nr:energy-coupling factor transporter transmembrane protein EcfT [Lachnospiraceae bacterium]MDE6698884.1 energy-coupling factor transporter transmembrane protein EcfT [Lachnospiraceae bacterium]